MGSQWEMGGCREREPGSGLREDCKPLEFGYFWGDFAPR